MRLSLQSLDPDVHICAAVPPAAALGLIQVLAHTIPIIHDIAPGVCTGRREGKDMKAN
jgi:hypothetical protein